jgi:ABC-type Zn uptake system ZnuABC Zn-binding protein ZnuA
LPSNDDLNAGETTRTRGCFAPRVLLYCAAIVATSIVSSGSFAQQLRIVTTTSDLASLAGAVAGDLAQIDSMIPPATDPEAFEPRPSDLAKLKGAAVMVRIGLGYDHWLDKLLTAHGDARINRGGAGYIDASLGIPLIEVKGRSLDAANKNGHAHGLANPHYWLDPMAAEVITGGIAEGLIRIAPQSSTTIIANRDRFLARLKTRLADWERQLGDHRAARLVAYHNTWPYFARRFRVDIVDVIETKEGVTPSPARLAKLASIIREQKVRIILHEPFEPDDASQLLARRTGAVVLKLAPSVGALPEASNYLALFDYNVGLLARTLSAASN